MSDFNCGICNYLKSTEIKSFAFKCAIADYTRFFLSKFRFLLLFKSDLIDKFMLTKWNVRHRNSLLYVVGRLTDGMQVETDIRKTQFKGKPITFSCNKRVQLLGFIQNAFEF